MNSTNYFFNELSGTKTGLAFALLCLVLLAIWLPSAIFKFLFHSRNLTFGELTSGENNFGRVISTINCFAAGVLLTTGMLEIFPEVLEQVDSAIKKSGYKINFHTGSFIVICGILLILYIEEMINAIDRIAKKRIVAKSTHFQPETSSETLIDKLNDKSDYKTFSFNDGHTENTADDKKDGEFDIRNVYILIAALSFHSIFEGIALGLQKDMRSTMVLFMGLMIHKTVIALTVGFKMIHACMHGINLIACSWIFASSTPIGICIGIVLIYLKASFEQSLNLISGIFQGLACGTILYIVFFEILPPELMTRTYRWTKIIGLTIGVLLVSVMLYILG